jgi:ubiquinone/menaquinone biosynthesis C-methylase UbiE
MGAEKMNKFQQNIENGYNLVAAEYSREYCDELDKKPFDRKMLDWLAEKVNRTGPICDLGCGPGQIARYFNAQEIESCGIDLSDEMVKEARRLNPDISFQKGDMLHLTNVPDDSFTAIAAFYSIIHIPREQVLDALRELKRVLRPNGILLITFHIGKDHVHRDEWWGKSLSLDFLFFEREEMKAYIISTGLTLDEVIERDPYPPEIEYQSRRAYIFARKL